MSKKLALLALAAGIGLTGLTLRSFAAEPKADIAKAIGDAKAEVKQAVAEAKAELPQPGADGFIDLFNGKDLTGWEGQEGFWSVKDGAITATETKEKSRQTFLVLKGVTVTDFELHWKYKFVTKDGNSGIQFRSKVMDPKKDPYKVGGYQADCDAGNTYTGIIYDEAGGAGGRGIMSKRGEKTHWTAEAKPKTEKLEKSNEELKQVIKPSGEWNECTLTVKGNHFVYTINGNVTTDLTDESPKLVKEGIIALQCHAGFTMEIQFKDLKFKPLTEK